MSSFDASLLQIFSTEQSEHIGRIRALLDRVPAGVPLAGVAIEEVQRSAHTLKGAARAVGLARSEAVMQELEEVVSGLRRDAIPFSADSKRTLEKFLDAAEDALAGALGATAPDAGETTGNDRPTASGDLVRVTAEHLDDLIRSSSQILIATTTGAGDRHITTHAMRMEETAREWRRLRVAASPNIRRLRDDPTLAPLSGLLNLSISK